ncbi:MAG: hypothetical protein CM15mP106_6980 [Candidatus Neomarinimicrobiota bacterium]|nr:MAG: hypothetical protein CM15mP106_6980 [Candidatus Neomarinimicrobiota bacterium]
MAAKKRYKIALGSVLNQFLMHKLFGKEAFQMEMAMIIQNFSWLYGGEVIFRISKSFLGKKF